MTKTLFIGLDGATFTVLDEMTRELPDVGVTMPFLKRLLATGVRAKLASTPNPLTPPAWTSIMTGRSPGCHGIFDFIRAEERADDVYFTLFDSRDIKSETIWSIASRQERRVVALNFPLTAPPRRGSGSVVPGFVPWKHLRRNISPPELYVQLKQLPDFDPKQLAWDFELEKLALEDLDEAAMEAWVRYHLPRERQWYKLAEFLLPYDPALMAVMFDGTDKIQHQAWQFLDPELVTDHPSEWQARMRSVCLDYFRNLDRYIESLVTLAGPDAQVFMASDHGFAATTHVFRLNTFLHDKGYLKWKTYDDNAVEERRNGSNFANVDWRETLAYCPTPSSNGIAIRVARSPGEPGVRPEDYASFRQRIIDELLELRDAETNARVVESVMKREDVFPGPYMDDAPDLTLGLADHGFVSIRNLRPITIRRRAPAGTHHPDGIFIAAGNGIRQGLLADRRPIVDVAPALLYSLGLAVPEDLEGNVPIEFFTAEYTAVHPVVHGPPTMRVDEGEVQRGGMAADDKNRIIRQLQMLGYME